MIVNVSTIPHDKHRYETVGDWIVDNPNVPAFSVLVSDMGNPDYAFLVALHEQVEMYLCWKRGITQESVDAFDKKFEANRPEDNYDEPGDDPKAPYFREHQFATNIEKMMAAEIRVDWDTYNTTVEGL